MAGLYCLEAQPGGLVGKLEPALCIWPGPWPTCLPGDLQGHLHLSSALCSPKTVPSWEGAPSALPGWVGCTWPWHRAVTVAVTVTVAAEAPHCPGAATHGNSSFSGWIQKMEQVSKLADRE